MQTATLSPRINSVVDNSPLFIKAPGTCGELMQGAIDGQDFLVNCPIDLFSYAKLQSIETTGLHLHNENSYTKIRDTIDLVMDEYKLKLNHSLKMHSNIPRGKGMASSSADITAAFEAICRCSDIALTPEDFAHIVTEIEASDLVHFLGISHLNHLTGKLFESMPVPQGMSILVVDCGGYIATDTFDRRQAHSLYRNNQPYLKETLKLLKFGLHNENLAAVAKAATRSAKFNQKIHYKPQFDDLLAISQTAGALGVNCAHSGTVLGVMYRSNDKVREFLLNDITQHFGSDISIVGNFMMISGGCYEY